MEFDLAYYGKITDVVSIQSTPVFERNWYFKKLAETKKKEAKDEENRASKQAAGPKTSKPVKSKRLR